MLHNDKVDKQYNIMVDTQTRHGRVALLHPGYLSNLTPVYRENLHKIMITKTIV